MSAFWILVHKEFHGRASRRGYWIFTIVGLAILIGLTFLPGLLSSINDKSKSTVLIADPKGILAQEMIAQAASDPSTYHFVLKQSKLDSAGLTKAALAEKVKAEHSHLLITINGDTPRSASVTVQEVGSVDPSLVSSVETLAQKEITAARIASLPSSTQTTLTAPIHTHVIQLQAGAKSNSQLWESRAVVYYMLILLFATITIYGSWVAQGVVQEKSNRVIEMMLVTTKPWQILFGKIVGIGFVGILQYVIWIAGAGVAFSLRSHLAASAFTDVPIATLALMPVFFVIGYILYATLYGIAGSLVTRVEEQQMALTPVVLLMLVLFYVSLFGVLPAPDSTFSIVASFVPIITPMAMFTRTALSVQGVSAWQIMLSICLTLALNGVLVWYGASVYKRFALRNSGKSSWKLLFQRTKESDGTKAY
jgi:ABC-2 type transport system permease protein